MTMFFFFLNLFCHPRNPRSSTDRDKHSDNFKKTVEVSYFLTRISIQVNS